jgi:hypothetical protein
VYNSEILEQVDHDETPAIFAHTWRNCCDAPDRGWRTTNKKVRRIGYLTLRSPMTLSFRFVSPGGNIR